MEKLKKCRFFRGEASCPFTDRSSIFFWSCERLWCRRSDGFSQEVKALKSARLDDFATDEFGGERIPLSLLAVIYSKAKKGWSFVRLLRLYFGFDPAGSYALMEKVPTSVVTRDGVSEEVEDDSWWQGFLSGCS